MIRLLIADDHKIFRQCLKTLLVDERDMVVSAEAAGYGEALAALRQQAIDVAIVDLTMPGRDGIELIGQLKEIQPSLRVLALTMHTQEHYVVRAMRAGADGYVTKECASDELIGAIRKLVNGQKFVSSDVAARLTLAVATGDLGAYSHIGLSGREFKILEMVVAGKRGSEIAAELSLSEKTVSSHKSNILSKLNLRSDADLVRYAVHQGLIRLDDVA